MNKVKAFEIHPEQGLSEFGDALVPDEALIALVNRKPTLFPSAVRMLAQNRHNKESINLVITFHQLAPAGLIVIMREVRDELNDAISQCHTEGKVIE